MVKNDLAGTRQVTIFWRKRKMVVPMLLVFGIVRFYGQFNLGLPSPVNARRSLALPTLRCGCPCIASSGEEVMLSLLVCVSIKIHVHSTALPQIESSQERIVLKL